MVRKTCLPGQIINKLREAEILLNQGVTIAAASRKIGVTEQTCYRWRKEYGGMRIEQARRLKELEQGNYRLKRLVADLSPDNAILEEASGYLTSWMNTPGNAWRRWLNDGLLRMMLSISYSS